MKKVTKKLGFLLVSTMLLSAAACASDTGNDTADTTAADTTAVTTEDLGYTVPEVVNYEGYEYRIGINENRNTGVRILFTDTATGEIVNDAVYDRNEKVSELYNISIVGVPDTANAIQDRVKNTVLSGDDIYDTVAISARQHFVTARENYLLDVNSVGSLDLEAPWWDPAILEAFEVNGKNFALVGDITTVDDVFAFVTLFNTKLYEDLGFDDPYAIVSDGKWTFDTFWTMAKSGSYDLDGDGEMTQNDRWGFITEIDAWYYYAAGAGFEPISHNDSGKLVYTFDDEKTFNILDKTKQLYLDDQISMIAQNAKVTAPHSTIWQVVEAMFMQNQGLFKSGTFNDVTRYRDMEVDFGVLPVPKYDEAQENYRNLVTYHIDSFTFPITISDVDRTMRITDALGYESMISINPLFYEIFLDEKLVRDENSKAMIDIMLDNKVYDMEWTANISGLPTTMSQMAKSRSDSFSSTWASIKDSSNAKLEEFVEAFED